MDTFKISFGMLDLWNNINLRLDNLGYINGAIKPFL